MKNVFLIISLIIIPLSQISGKTIALIQINQQAQFFTEMNRGAESAATKKGHKLLIFNANKDPAAQNNAIETYIQQGVDGLIVVDLPFPENKNFAEKCKKKNINFIQLISPTTSKTRLKQIVKNSHDMIYYISMLSTTGGKLKVSPKKILEEYSKIKKQNLSKNVVIGFGITEKTIKSLKKADGLVVGSAICKEITNSIKKRQNTVTNVTNVVKKLRKKIK